MKIFGIRRDYTATTFNFNELKQNPMDQFDLWFKDAIEFDEIEPNAMAFATSTTKGVPSVRYLLLKAYDTEGCVFFTNYESLKSQHLKSNPNAAMVFYWQKAQRQVRIEGKINLLSDLESDEYFNERPNGSKIGAWASPQSKPIPSREYLENLKEEYQKKYSQFMVPRPKFWGGYKLIPRIVEFWQGRPDRLHDRFQYQLREDNVWKKERLAP